MSDKVIRKLEHILGFQLNDLRKASILATANFLVAIGCMNTIEFLGGVRKGLLGLKGKVEERFKEGVRLLIEVSEEYRTFGEKRMYSLRNALTHQYLPEAKEFKKITIANDWASDKALIMKKDELVVNVARLVIDLSTAWGRLRTELEQDQDKREHARKALNRLPELL